MNRYLDISSLLPILKWFRLIAYQVGEMTGNEIRPFLKSRIMIPIRLCSLLIHSPGICMLGPIE